MVKYWKTDDRLIHEEVWVNNGVWVQMINPTVAEGQEIAEKLNLPLGTVKSRIFFTRQKLQQELKDFR